LLRIPSRSYHIGVSDWTNPCGGTPWRELEDGAIEVQGAGVPLYEPGHARHDIVVGTWNNWGCLLADAAERYGLPTSWLVGIACVETGPWWGDPVDQAEAVSHAGARGIMQIMPSTARLLDYDPDQMFTPEVNVDAGANLIRRLSDRIRSGLPAICGAYNSGKVCCDDPRGCRPGCENQYRVCTDGDYPGAAIRYNNTAVAYLDLSPCRGGVGLASAATAGLFVVGAWGLWQWWSKR
jgi:hypothetical protein